MRIQSIAAGLVIAFGVSMTAPQLCQAAASNGNAPQQPIYIGDFKAAPAQSGSSSGPLSHLGASHQAGKVEKNAAALAEALVRELNARGVASYRLSDENPAPNSGWVVSGVFSETVPHGLFSQFSSLGSSTPNTEVKVSIVDLGSASHEPARVMSTAASLGGQGSAISLNPYVMAAKVVVHHVESGRSIDDLARRIADQILAQRA